MSRKSSVTKAWVEAGEATRILGVSRATLYAYVSRGFVRSEPVPGRPRERHYSREDVERLRSRAEERKNPEKAAENALRWGVPVLESAITLIAGGKLYYRGHDVVALARERTLEEVASLIWTGTFDADIFDTPLHVIGGGSTADLPFVARAQSILPLVGARDPLAFDLRPKAIAQSGWRIVNLLTSVAGETSELEPTVEETLARHWVPEAKNAAALIRAALIVCADHELNVSAFTARCVASAGSNPYSVVVAGLAALEGAKHGGVTARVQALFDEVRRSRDLRKALAERLKRGDTLDGFGHQLYPNGDPRAALLLDLLRESLPKSKELAFAQSLAAAAESVTGEHPTLDFGLVALARALELPEGAPLTLFAIGRTLGWIGHAIEQYAMNAMIRPRARYVGEGPGKK
ncbi:MAG TPA: citrate/2-methylcitrate synthase [Thermoanaerobaculia bacterium]|nr:citrate/2-methylcitrate synthase [Thermoanaerobaculia bacterium]